MATFKRKAPTLQPQEGKNTKKSKKNGLDPLKRKERNLETETDSDPIVESETTEHSGDDDGVSWPSDREEEEEEGGVELPTGASTESANSKSLPSRENVKIAKNSSSSREAHAKQKAMVQERKAAKPNAESLARSMKIWERLRRKSHVPLAERKELVSELFDIITGRIKDFVFKHDSVRVIQTALKYANVDQRKMIAGELKGDYRSLAESRYAKFLIGKIIVHGDSETRDLVIPEFYGYVRQLIKHPEASWILDDIYRGSATPTQKANLIREWYGAEFAIFRSIGQAPDPAELKELLRKYPEKRTPIMHSLLELINGLVQKRTTGFTMLHDAMLQYFLNVQPGSEENQDFIELLKSDDEGDLLKNLAFTKSGSRVVCLALAYGTAKDRKLILKTYKKFFQDLAYDPSGHRVLLAIYDVVDDTVLTSKSIFPELTGEGLSPEDQNQVLLSSVNDLNARITILYPFCGLSKAILPKEDLTLLAELHAIRTTTSKKDPEIRRIELAASLSPPLLSFIATNTRLLVSTSFGCQFITDILLGAPSTSSDRTSALTAIATLARPDSPVDLTSSAAGRMLKTLVLGGRFNPNTRSIDRLVPPLGFHNLLYGSLGEDRVVEWAKGGNSFVIVGLLEAEGFGEKEGLVKVLKKRRKELKGGNQGTKLVLGMIDG